MPLRDHPLMTFRGVQSWPPVWIWTGGTKNKRPRGEVGILEEVLLPNINPSDRCFLYISHEGSSYIGSLLIEDKAFCSQVVNLLRKSRYRSIAAIGSMDLAHTL
jgi:hypothetical protein